MKFIVLVYLIISIFYTLNLLNLINFYSFFFKAATISYSVFLILFLIKDFINYLKFRKSLKDDLKYFQEGMVYVYLKEDDILLSIVSDKNYSNLKWSSISKILVLKNTLYFIPNFNYHSLIIINKNEIIEGDFDDVIRFANKTLKSNRRDKF